MAISADYPTPVTVNGFSCKNCTEVDLANKHIDPAHPKDGPFGINADVSKDPLDVQKADARHKSLLHGPPSHGPAVRFGGALAGLDTPSNTPPPNATPPGQVLNLSA
jgi:hypothetical protein